MKGQRSKKDNKEGKDGRQGGIHCTWSTHCGNNTADSDARVQIYSSGECLPCDTLTKSAASLSAPTIILTKVNGSSIFPYYS